MGITFTVYSDGQGIDRAWPFDIIPRVIDAAEWRDVEAGLVQRLTALNRFIDDLYNDQRIIADGVFPAELLAAVGQLPARVPRRPPPASGCGRTSAAATSCATPTARCTSSRTTCGCRRASATCSRTASISKRAFADLFPRQSILPVDGYTDELHKLLASLAPDGARRPARRSSC